MQLLSKILGRLIKTGTLTVIDVDGRTHRFEGSPGPQATMRLKDKSLYRSLVFKPELAFGEGYMDGTLEPEGHDVYDLLALIMANRENLAGIAAYRWVTAVEKIMRPIHQANHARRAKANVAHHYDISNDLYKLFLDADMQYSCAYFRSPEDTLEQAQLNKKLHIAAKLNLKPGMKVLDIGCGWGGMAMTLAQLADVEVLGITLSEAQIELGRERVKATGLEDKVRLELMDYRNVDETFDRMVSVGMFEHVGAPNYDTFFGKLSDILKPDGVALLHSIGRMSPPGSTGPWIRKYIFPGGYTPALSEVFQSTERSGLWVTDCEILRLHYAETLKHWRRRFLEHWDTVKEMNDERFCRMWEFYLAACEAYFRFEDGNVFQMQLTKDRAAVPLTRDYMLDQEKALHDAAKATGSGRVAAE